VRNDGTIRIVKKIIKKLDEIQELNFRMRLRFTFFFNILKRGPKKTEASRSFMK
jgi:hypothetical protein